MSNCNQIKLTAETAKEATQAGAFKEATGRRGISAAKIACLSFNR